MASISDKKSAILIKQGIQTNFATMEITALIKGRHYRRTYFSGCNSTIGGDSLSMGE